MRSRRIELVALLTALMLTAFSSSTWAVTFKTIHITNPSDTAAHDMHVTHTLSVSKVSAVLPGQPPKPPSNTFEGATGTGTNTVSFAGGGPLKKGETDHYNMESPDNLPAGEPPFAAKLITKVEFTNQNGEVFKTLRSDGSDDEKKEFKTNVRGFTNEEFYDFSNLSSASLHLLNSDADLNIRYTLFDVEVFANLPLTNFNIDHFTEGLSGNAVFATAQLVINPGDHLTIPLGSVSAGTYALASIGAITTEDLESGISLTTDIPQGYAQNVPEPSAHLLFGTGLLGILAYVWRKTKLNR